MSGNALGIALLILCAWVEGGSQVCFKLAVLFPRRQNLWAGLGSVVHLIEAVFYTAVLSLLDLSIAYPISGLAFVTTTCLSKWLLGERVPATRWLGVLVILAGTGLLASAT